MELKKQSWIILLVLSVAQGGIAETNSIHNTSSHLIPCKKGWFLFGDKCYKAFEKSKDVTWKSAEAVCARHHGHLVTIQSKELLDFLSIFLMLDVKSHVWIGLNDLEEESKYAWADGSVVNYTRWFYTPREDCAEMQFEEGKTGWWNAVKCNTHRPFMCQTNKSEGSMNHDPRFCSGENDGAWKYQNSCYHPVQEELSWDDAEDYCQTVFNGHLLAITDANVDLFLNYVLSDFKREFWIGVKIRAKNRSLWNQKWSSSRSVRYKKWVTELTLEMSNTCAYMTENRQWSTAPCFQKLPFVCEVDRPSLTQAPDGWRCPELSQDWIDLGGDTCYIFAKDGWRDWHKANFACLKKGGHLASIRSVSETNAIRPHIVGGLRDAMLIGLHRSLSNYTEFEWADGTVLDYENWKFGEPSSIYESCSEIQTNNMKWNDIGCDEVKPYICSAKKVPPFFQGSNESDVTNDVEMVSPQLVKRSCSAIVGLFTAVIALFVVGCTIDIWKNHCGKSNIQRGKHFSMAFSARKRTESKEKIEEDSDYGISLDSAQ